MTLAAMLLALFLGSRLSRAEAQNPVAGAPPPGSGSLNVTGASRAIDGDTIDFFIKGNEVAVGLIGIAAPAGNTPCGRTATSTLQKLVLNGVHLVEDPAIGFDSLGRRMYYASTPAGQSIELALVRAGVASPNGAGTDQAALAAAAATARAAATGCLYTGPVNGVDPLKPSPAPVPNVRALAPRSTPLDTLPTGFSEDVVAAAPIYPTSFAFLPDGRILMASKSGVIFVWQNGAVVPTPLIDISSEVSSYWDRGMLDIAPDPNFASNGYLYLLYVYEDNPNNYTGQKSQRLTRVTVVGNTASPSSEVTILGTEVGPSCGGFPVGSDCIPSDFPSHTVDSIRFAPDGTMYVSIGDDSNYNIVDPNALRAQNVDVLAGKLLHITTSGQGLSSNPFWNGDPNANRSKVWAYGLRNPFRFNIRASNGVPYIGQVGWNTWETLEAGTKGANFGWPCYEGPNQQAGYAALSGCQALYAQGGSAWTPPVFSYDHCCGSSAIVGGGFITNPAWPAPYQGAYFYLDYGRSMIHYLQLDSNGNYIANSDTLFGTTTDQPVDAQIGPDGNFYYLAINTGQVRRIRYLGASTPPVATATATPAAGLAPLTVQFSSAGSRDPNGGTLTYSWTFGDGSPASTDPNPTHTYQTKSNYIAILTVTDSAGLTATAPVNVTTSAGPPVATITAPASTLTYRVGDTITYAGSATDPQDGALAPSHLSWQIIIHHCPGGGTCHTHYFLTTTGSGGSFVVPDHGDYSYFELILTATDSVGLTATASVSIHPQTVPVTLQTAPAGLQIVYDGTALTAPATVNSIVGSAHSMYAPSPQNGSTFAYWSDGGAQNHDITLGSSAVSFTASFDQPLAYTVYHDSLSSGWVDWSFAATANFASTSPVYAGSDAISFTTQTWGGLEVHSDTGVNTASLAALQFAAQASQSGQVYGVVLDDANENIIGHEVYLANAGGNPVPGAWTLYTIPLASFGASGATIHSIAIQDEGGHAEPALSVDELGFTSNGSVNPSPCTAATLTASPAGSAPVGSVVGLTAQASGCPNPQYQFWALPPGGSWTALGPYATSPTASWNTVGAGAGSAALAVWAKDASSSQPYDAFQILSPYTLTSAGGTCTGATLTPSASSPQALPATITFTAAAAPSNGATCEYEFWGLPVGGTWTVAQSYSTTNTFTWSVPAGTTQGADQIAVWVKATASGAGYDSYAIVPYTLGCSVSLSASPAGPANGASVTFTATPTSSLCSANLQYQWWALPPGGSWTLGVDYASASTLTVASTGVQAGTWDVAVLVRASGSSAAYDTYAIIPYVFGIPTGSAAGRGAAGGAQGGNGRLPAPPDATTPQRPSGPGFPTVLPRRP